MRNIWVGKELRRFAGQQRCKQPIANQRFCHVRAEVAQTLVITISTVKTHTNSIFGKLRVTSHTQAIALARNLQLLYAKPPCPIPS